MSTDRLVSVSEVAQILGLTRSRVHQLAKARPGESRALLEPAMVVRHPITGRITQIMFRESDVMQLKVARQDLPPAGRGPVRWHPG